MLLSLLKACASVRSTTRGEKSAFIAHILGSRNGKPCIHASADAIATAKLLKYPDIATSSTPATSGTKHNRSASTDQGPLAPKKLKQANLLEHAYRGVDMPFSAVQAQALQAVISANLLFRVYEDPEVIKLFWMMQTAAPDILPSEKAVGGRLLNDAVELVELKMDKLLHGRSIGLV